MTLPLEPEPRRIAANSLSYRLVCLMGIQNIKPVFEISEAKLTGKCKLAILFGVWCLSVNLLIGRDDWPHWRGPQRNDQINESSGFRDGRWPVKELWSLQIGSGSSSPVIVGKTSYHFVWSNGHEILAARSCATGKRIWEKSYRAPRYGRLATGDQGLFSGPSSTPEFDPGTRLIYTLGSDGKLTAWDTAQQGQLVWQRSLHDEYPIPRRPKVGRSGLRDYGFTSSPLVLGDTLIVEVGSTQGNLIAFDKRTGQELWRSESKSSAGHNGGPVPIQVGKIPCVAVFNHDGLSVCRVDRPNAGEEIAHVKWITSFANNIATVAVDGNRVLITSGYNQNKMALYEISLSGARRIWEKKSPSKICTPIIHDGHIYFCWRTIKCLDLKTGDLKWEGGNTGDAGSMILTSDDRLIVWSKRGDLALIETAKRSPDKLKILASKRVLAKADAWPHVVLAQGRIFCKDQAGNLKCLSVND